MTPAARLRQQAAELLQIADELDTAIPTRAPGHDPFFLDTGRALAICRRSHSWLYKNARKYHFGWQLPSKSWAFSEAQLRDFMGGRAGREKSEESEKSDAATLSISPRARHGGMITDGK